MNGRARVWNGIALTLWLLAASAHADTLGVKGDTLRGSVTNLTPAGVVFDPVYGEGVLTVPWADVESIQTEAPVTVLYGDSGEVTGPVLGLDANGALLIGADRATAHAVQTSELFGVMDGEDSLRSRFRHWKASFDAGGSFTDGTDDRVSGSLGLRFAYDKGPFHWLLEGNARFSEEKDRSGDDAGTPNDPSDDIISRDRSVTENVQIFFTRGEYDFVERLFAFTSLRLTRDTVQELALRTEPKAGLGARLVERDCFKLSADLGAAFVDEDFFGGERDNFWALAFGANAEASLPYGTTWRARVELVPSIVDWEEDFLLRATTELDFPLAGWLSVVLSAEEEYDRTPAQFTHRNRFTSAASLRARFP